MKIKVALCIPAYGMVHAKWFQCVMDMVVYTQSEAKISVEGEPVEIVFNTFLVQSSNLCESRHRICAEAVMWEANYLLWLDADHVFPKDTFCRLWSRNLEIVGANYSRRCIPTAPTAAKLITNDKSKDHSNLVYTTREKAEADLVEEVSHLGFGVCLMNVDIFNKLTDHALANGEKSMMPLFVFGMREDGLSPIGEDVYFFRKCRQAGIKVHCDHAVSEEVGHVHETIIFNCHAVQQEEEWVALTRELPARIEAAATESEAKAA